MRHIRRTHQVELDSLFETFNINEGIIDIRYFHTSLQIADIFAKGTYDPTSWKRFTAVTGLRYDKVIDVDLGSAHASCAVLGNDDCHTEDQYDGSHLGPICAHNSFNSVSTSAVYAMAQDTAKHGIPYSKTTPSQKQRVRKQEGKKVRDSMNTFEHDNKL